MQTDIPQSLIARSRVKLWLPFLVFVVIFVFAWQEYALHDKFVLPTWGAMWTSLSHNGGLYWKAARGTLREIAVGASCGIVAAIAVAVIISEFRVLERAVMPYLVVMMMTPIVAIAPAMVLAFGFGPFPKYLITGIVGFPAMVIHTLAGLRNVDGRALDVFETVDASRWEKFRYLRLQSSLPFVFVGLRIALPVAVVGATVAELAAPGVASGLAAMVSTSSATGSISVAWTAILLLILMGVLLMGVWGILRRRFLWWDNEAALARRAGN